MHAPPLTTDSMRSMNTQQTGDRKHVCMCVCVCMHMQWGLEAYGSPESLGLPQVGAPALGDPNCLLAVRRLNHDHLMMALKRTFERYNLWNNGVNKVRDSCMSVCVRAPLRMLK